MYTKILAQETKFGSGTTGLDNPAIQFSEWEPIILKWVGTNHSKTYIEYKLT